MDTPFKKLMVLSTALALCCASSSSFAAKASAPRNESDDQRKCKNIVADAAPLVDQLNRILSGSQEPIVLDLRAIEAGIAQYYDLLNREMRVAFAMKGSQWYGMFQTLLKAHTKYKPLTRKFSSTVLDRMKQQKPSKDPQKENRDKIAKQFRDYPLGHFYIGIKSGILSHPRGFFLQLHDEVLRFNEYCNSIVNIGAELKARGDEHVSAYVDTIRLSFGRSASYLALLIHVVQSEDSIIFRPKNAEPNVRMVALPHYQFTLTFDRNNKVSKILMTSYDEETLLRDLIPDPKAKGENAKAPGSRAGKSADNGQAEDDHDTVEKSLQNLVSEFDMTPHMSPKFLEWLSDLSEEEWNDVEPLIRALLEGMPVTLYPYAEGRIFALSSVARGETLFGHTDSNQKDIYFLSVGKTLSLADNLRNARNALRELKITSP